jgi:hypothetical protein
LAIFAIGTDKGEAASLAGSTALRDAAVDMLYELDESPHTGVQRPTGSVGWFIAPTAALRASWNGGYIDEGSSSHSRYSASLNWPRLLLHLRRRESSYLGLQITFVDVLAPFSELALRSADVSNAANPDRLWWNVLRPGVDIVFGVPSLSDHVVLGLGGSIRIARVFADNVAHPDSSTTYTYRSILDCAEGQRCDGGRFLLPANLGQFVEANLSAQYAF